MERLTRRNGKYVEYSDENYSDSVDNYTMLDNCLRKLADYEDAEEQGLLLRLPCPERTTVYCIGSCGEICDCYEIDCDALKCKEHQVVFTTIFDRDMVEQFGKTVFLTKEEAEEKLASMQKGE